MPFLLRSLTQGYHGYSGSTGQAGADAAQRDLLHLPLILLFPIVKPLVI